MWDDRNTTVRYKFTICHDCYNYGSTLKRRPTDRQTEAGSDRRPTDHRKQDTNGQTGEESHTLLKTLTVSPIPVPTGKQKKRRQLVIYLVLIGSTCYLSGVNWFTG